MNIWQWIGYIAYTITKFSSYLATALAFVAITCVLIHEPCYTGIPVAFIPVSVCALVGTIIQVKAVRYWQTLPLEAVARKMQFQEIYKRKVVLYIKVSYACVTAVFFLLLALLQPETPMNFIIVPLLYCTPPLLSVCAFCALTDTLELKYIAQNRGFAIVQLILANAILAVLMTKLLDIMCPYMFI